MGDALGELIAPAVAKIALGLGVGALVAVLLCVTVPGLKRRDAS